MRACHLVAVVARRSGEVGAAHERLQRRHRADSAVAEVTGRLHLQARARFPIIRGARPPCCAVTTVCFQIIRNLETMHD